jgi:hypothetical protein
MKLNKFGVLVFAACVASVANAGVVIATGSDTIDGTESISGTLRLFRDGVPSEWGAAKSFSRNNRLPK